MHGGDGLSLLHSVGALSWEDSKTENEEAAETQNHPETASLTHWAVNAGSRQAVDHNMYMLIVGSLCIG